MAKFRIPQGQFKRYLFWTIAFFCILSILLLVIGDTEVYSCIRFSINRPFWDQGLRLFTTYGNYPFYFLCLWLILYGRLKNRPELFYLGITIVLSLLVGSVLITRSLKIIIGRPRPGVIGSFSPFNISSKFNSFPSGHSADTFCSVAVLFYLLKRYHYKILLLIYALAASYSRILVGSHYPSDILAGAFIGAMTGFAFSEYYFLKRLPGMKKTAIRGR